MRVVVRLITELERRLEFPLQSDGVVEELRVQEVAAHVQHVVHASPLQLQRHRHFGPLARFLRRQAIQRYVHHAIAAERTVHDHGDVASAFAQHQKPYGAQRVQPRERQNSVACVLRREM